MDPEPTPLSDQDKIRLKRIAKLQQQQEDARKAQAAAASTSAPQPATAAVPSSSTSAPKPKPITIKRAAPPSPPAAPVARREVGFTDSFAQWENAALGRILQVTLNTEAAERSGWSLTYLADVVADLASDSSTSTPHQITTGLLDQLVLGRLMLSPTAETEDPVVLTVIAALPPNQTAFEYLSGCWKRERIERSRVMAKKSADADEANRRFESLNELKRLVVSYLGLILIEPTMFPQDHVTGKKLGPNELVPFLLDEPAVQSQPSTEFQPTDFPALLHDLVGHEAGLEGIIEPLVQALASLILTNKIDIGGGGNQTAVNWRGILGAVQSLSEVKGVPAAMVNVALWDPTTVDPPKPPQHIEYFALLGAFIRLSTFADSFPAIATSYFPDAETMGRGNQESASTSLRGTLGGVQKSIFAILNNIVRAGAEPRQAVLSLLGHINAANKKRAGTMVDPNAVSSHGFIINIHTALLSFAEPFMDSQYTKIDKIDPLYYKHSDRIDLTDETKMSATAQEAAEFYAPPAERAPAYPAPNFISEIFFLTIAYQHIGVMSAIRTHKDIGRNVSHYKRSLTEIEVDTTWRGTPGEARVLAQIEKIKERMKRHQGELAAFEVQLLDPAYLQRVVGFANLVMAWLVRLVDPKKAHPQTRVTLPMPEQTPELFRMLPEYIIEDITELITFVSKYAPQVLAQGSQDELLTFMLVFLSTPYMKNPYLQGQFVEIMYYLTRPMHGYPRGSLGDALNFNPLALAHLMPALIRAYTQIEITGSHTQFYDKFNTRYYVAQLFKLVWDNSTHRESLQTESRKLDSYVRFANLLMNDITYLFGDALDHLHKISEMQKQMDDTEAWQAKPAAERQEQEKQLRQWESSVKSDLELGQEQLRLLKLFANETKDPFLAPEIVDRLAAMIDGNISLLAGPRCQDLKVRDPDKYKFKPTELLSDFLAIFRELGTRREFQVAVAKDGRSYSRDLFARAERIALKRALLSEAELGQLRAIVDAVELVKTEEEEDDASGEVPDEFLDPLTYEIMKDPVMLPSSKTVVDRSTIRQHHMSDATDPFNRVPLDLNDLIDATELREQIQAFLRERREKRLAAAVPVVGSTDGEGEDVVMDTA